MDCHATASQCLAMTEKRLKIKKPEKLGESQAAGFVDDFWGFQAVGAGIYLVGNEQAHRAESPKSAAKPTPTNP